MTQEQGQIVIDAWIIAAAMTFLVSLVIFIWTYFLKPPELPNRPRINEREQECRHNKGR